MAKSPPMKLLLLQLAALSLFASAASAQTFARSPTPAPAASSDAAAQLEALTKKIDQQNAKIDTLSQQILKLEQQLSSSRPGVMIGEGAPSPTATATAATSTFTSAPATPSPSAAGGNSHVVARGETLTSIAKMHNVPVTELQKFNHIENDRKLQIGQTIMIPSSPTPAASP
jgi:LysM repeat protein